MMGVLLGQGIVIRPSTGTHYAETLSELRTEETDILTLHQLQSRFSWSLAGERDHAGGTHGRYASFSGRASPMITKIMVLNVAWCEKPHNHDLSLCMKNLILPTLSRRSARICHSTFRKTDPGRMLVGHPILVAMNVKQKVLLQPLPGQMD